MDHKRYKIVSSVLGGSSETLYGCKRCGLVSFDMDLHENFYHAEPVVEAKEFVWDGTDQGIDDLIRWWRKMDPEQNFMHQGLEGGTAGPAGGQKVWMAFVDEVENTSTDMKAGDKVCFNGTGFYLGR